MKLKIEKTENGHDVFINGNNISMNVKRMEIELDPKKYGGNYALVKMELLTEIDLDVDAVENVGDID